MIIFADTSAFFALIVQDDLMHVRARENFAYFSKNDVQLLTSSYILLETFTLLQRRIGLEAVQDFNAKIFPLLEIIWVDAEWHNRAIQRVLVQKRKDISLTDCLSFEIMEALEITEAYTFDRHFADHGFTIAAYHNLDVL